MATVARLMLAMIGKLEDACAGVLLLTICAATATQVVCRFILQSPLAWSDELATYSFVWLALLGAAMAVREGAHLGVDALTRILPERSRLTLALVMVLVVQALLVCLVFSGIELMMRIVEQRSSGLQLPMVWVYLALPVSSGLMLVHTLPQLLSLARDFPGAARRMEG